MTSLNVIEVKRQNSDVELLGNNHLIYEIDESYRGPKTVALTLGGCFVIGPFSLLFLMFKFDKRKRTIIR